MDINNKKEIKVKLINKESLTYELLEDAKKGDWFSIASEVQNYINTKTDEQIKSLTSNIRNDILANDENIKKMKDKIELLKVENEKLKGENKSASANLSKQHSQEIGKKDFEIFDLKNQIENYKKQQNNEIEKIRNELKNKNDLVSKNLEIKHKDEINEKEIEINNLKNEINNYKKHQSVEIEKIKAQQEIEIKEKIEKEIEEKLEKKYEEKGKQRISDVSTGFNETIKKLEEELNKYKNKNINSKEIGENLENWILERYKTVFPLGYENDESVSFNFKKDTENLKDEDEAKGTKSDFIFTIYDKKNDISDLIILEAKSESKEKPGKQKNKDFFKKLENDRIKKKARYAILVSELEPDQYITIEIAPKFPKIFICRPHFYLALLMILKSMIIKENRLSKNVESLEEKEKIIKDFEEWKNGKLIKTAEKIKKKSEEGIVSSAKIIDEATKIKDNLTDISEKQFMKLTKEIDNFKITKITKKIEKITEKYG